MKINLSPRFKRAYKKLPAVIRSDFEVKITIFVKNPRDPKIRTHKLEGKLQSCYSFCLIKGFRVLIDFIDSETINLLDIGHHDKYSKWST